MDRDQRPANLGQDIRDLQNDVRQAQGSAGSRQPLTEASAGWVFTDRTTPPTPTAGKTHIYSQGGRLWALSAGAGAVPLLIPPPPQGVAVSNAANITSGNAPATWNDTWGQQMYDGLVSTKDTLNELLSSLRTAGIISSF